MALSLTRVKNLIGSTLNATRGGYGNFSTDADPLFPEDWIDDAITAAANSIMGVIFDTPGHRFRARLVELINYTNNTVAGGPVGAVLVDSSLGTLKKPSQIRRFALDINNTGKFNGRGFYAISDQVITFIGSTGKVQTIKYTLPAINDFLAELENYEGPIIDGALHWLFAKQGTNIEAASLYGGIFTNHLQMIRNGAISIPATTGGTAGG